MNRLTARLVALTACVGFALAFVFLRPHEGDPFSPEADRVLLLVPDGTDFSDPQVTVWLDAGSEEGLHVVPMRDSSFMRPLFGKPRFAGVILPDSIHLKASDLLVSAVRDYVSAGGKLLLVYDAGTKSLDGYYSGDRSRLSNLAGVDYALYNTLREGMIQSANVGGTVAVMNRLGVPPGKYFPLSAPSSKGVASSGDDNFEVVLRRYKYGDLEYPSFVTSGAFSGQVLLRSPAGIVAGYHPFHKGSVLFVNLPLGYLDGYTDGLPLHAFVKYFATEILSLPYLMPVPDGVGGLVLNWHVDSNAAIKALQEMSAWHILDQGPYSIDITAGPDTYAFGDHRGFDVLHNRVSQHFVREYVRLGNEVGSHGGWIHNYFGEHVDTEDPQVMEKFLQLNKDALEQVAGKPVREYSAPIGNQPQWVTRWLEERHFVGYYFTGDTGLGPTRGYRDGQRAGQTIWAFPILHLDRAASFEEMTQEGYSDSMAREWLDRATDFAVNQRQVRLIYFHPPGILPYEQVIREWLKKTEQLRAAGVFRWYTMTQLGNFLNSREEVKWKLSERNHRASLEAANPQSLSHQTWWLPAARFSRPSVVQGAARIQECPGGWLVVAGEEKYLKVEAGSREP
jgi:peptidoglycan/xylan/chitin deacetylase (PgdA/CDA1 family)